MYNLSCGQLRILIVKYSTVFRELRRSLNKSQFLPTKNFAIFLIQFVNIFITRLSTHSSVSYNPSCARFFLLLFFYFPYSRRKGIYFTHKSWLEFKMFVGVQNYKPIISANIEATQSISWLRFEWNRSSVCFRCI